LEISDVESPGPGGTGCKSRIIRFLPRRLALAFPMTDMAPVAVPALKFMFK
jgi:hypothetical protein